MGSKKNKKTSSQPEQVGRPRKAKNKGKPAIDPPVPSPKSRPKPRPKRRSVPPEPDVLSAENESDAVLAAMEGLLGLSKAGKTHDGGASEVEDSKFQVSGRDRSRIRQPHPLQTQLDLPCLTYTVRRASYSTRRDVRS
jgi:hypothetical protein